MIKTIENSLKKVSKLYEATLELLSLSSVELEDINHDIIGDMTFKELASLDKFPQDKYYLLTVVDNDGFFESVGRIHTTTETSVHIKLLNCDSFPSHLCLGGMEGSIVNLEKNKYQTTWCLYDEMYRKFPLYKEKAFKLVDVLKLTYLKKNVHLLISKDKDGNWTEQSVSLAGYGNGQVYMLFMSDFKQFTMQTSLYEIEWFILDF